MKNETNTPSPQPAGQSPALGLASGSGRILTCVYCGHEYPQDTPAHGSQVLTDHIKVCEKHPMRKLEADKARLRGALLGLAGVSNLEEVNAMEAQIRIMAAPAADKAAILDALAALQET